MITVRAVMVVFSSTIFLTGPERSRESHLAGFNLQTKAFGLFNEFFDEISAGRPLGTSVVFDPVGHDDLAAGNELFKHQNVETRASGINPGGQSGRPPPMMTRS